MLVKEVELVQETRLVLAEMPQHLLDRMVLSFAPSRSLHAKPHQNLVTLHSGVQPGDKALDGGEIVIEHVRLPGCCVHPDHVLPRLLPLPPQQVSSANCRSCCNQSGQGVGSDEEASQRDGHGGKDQAGGGAAGDVAEQTVPSSGLAEMEVELLLELGEAVAHGVEAAAVRGIWLREGVVQLLEFLEGFQCPIALRLRQETKGGKGGQGGRGVKVVVVVVVLCRSRSRSRRGR